MNEGMKRVLHIIDGKPTISLVPKDWIKCAVLGEYRRPEEFMEDGVFVRTNCKYTYELPMEKYKTIREKIKEITNSEEYNEMWAVFIDQTEQETYGVPVGELIKRLNSLPRDSIIVFTQEGYYADTKYADIFDEPKFIGNGIGVPVYSIGNSQQS